MSYRNRDVIKEIEEESRKASEQRMVPLLVDLIRSKLIGRANDAMKRDDFERAANDYLVAAYIIPISGMKFQTLYGYKIGEEAIRIMLEDLDYQNTNIKITNDILREYIKFLDQK